MTTWTPLPTLTHPPIEWLGYAYYAALEPGVDVGTRLPGPDEDQTILHTGFLRLEAAGGSPAADMPTMFDLDLILHAYWGGEEDATKGLSQRATTTMLPPRNTVVSCPLTEEGPPLPWTIHQASVSQEPHRQTDPIVNLLRYRSMVTWRVIGREA